MKHQTTKQLEPEAIASSSTVVEESIESLNLKDKKELVDKLSEGPVDTREFLDKLKLAYDPRQRKRNKGQVKKLVESIRKYGKVIKNIEVVPALTMIKEGEILYDREGGELLTEDTPDIDDWYVVIDGDHRREAVESLMEVEPAVKFSSYVELADTSGLTCRQYQELCNNTNKQWDAVDRLSSVSEKYGQEEGKERVIDKMLEWRNAYGLSLRESYALLHLNDGYKKKMVIDSQEGKTLDDNLIGDKDNIKRGSELLEALLTGCGKESNLARSLAPVNAIINIYSNTPDGSKPKMVNDLKLSLKALTQDDRNSISAVKSVGEKSVKFKEILSRKIESLKTDEGKSAVESEAEKNEKDYEELKKGGPKGVEGSIKTVLREKMEEEKIPGRLTKAMVELAGTDGLDDVKKFIQSLNDDQVVNILSFSREPKAEKKLQDSITAAWTNYRTPEAKGGAK